MTSFWWSTVLWKCLHFFFYTSWATDVSIIHSTALLLPVSFPSSYFIGQFLQEQSSTVTVCITILHVLIVQNIPLFVNSSSRHKAIYFPILIWFQLCTRQLLVLWLRAKRTYFLVSVSFHFYVKCPFYILQYLTFSVFQLVCKMPFGIFYCIWNSMSSRLYWQCPSVYFTVFDIQCLPACIHNAIRYILPYLTLTSFLSCCYLDLNFSCCPIFYLFFCLQFSLMFFADRFQLQLPALCHLHIWGFKKIYLNLPFLSLSNVPLYHEAKFLFLENVWVVIQTETFVSGLPSCGLREGGVQYLTWYHIFSALIYSHVCSIIQYVSPCKANIFSAWTLFFPPIVIY